MNKYIPYNITCPLASCSRSNTCARYANYQKAKAEEASFMVLNTDLLQVEGEGCPYHLVSERQRWARGFSRLCKSIPSGNAKYLNVYTPFTQRGDHFSFEKIIHVFYFLFHEKSLMA